MPGFKPPAIGQPIWFFPHRGHHPDEYFAPHAAIVIHIHSVDPRIVHLYFFGPKGEVGSYADIPHRALRPDCYPVANWLGHAMPTSTHWSHVGETDEAGPEALPPQPPPLRPAP